jgi:hypothetical protein
VMGVRAGKQIAEVVPVATSDLNLVNLSHGLLRWALRQHHLRFFQPRRGGR